MYASYRRRRTLEFCSQLACVASASSVCVVRVCPAVERVVRWRCEGGCVRACATCAALCVPVALRSMRAEGGRGVRARSVRP